MNRPGYRESEGISRMTEHRDIQNGLIRKLDNGEIFQNQIVRVRLSEKDRAAIIAKHKQRYDELILCADPINKLATVLAIEKSVASLKRAGFTINGYDRKSIYRKINQSKKRGFSGRKPREDRGHARHPLLLANIDLIERLAFNTYMEHATGSINLVVDMMIHFSREREEYYGIAGISKPTLYRHITRAIKDGGYRSLHQYANHYNKWKATLPTCTGAFTDDIQFMQYICGDDHKCDVDAVLWLNPHTGKVEKKKVKIWFWCEAKTMFPLGWEIVVEDFTAEDLVKSLSRVAFQYGLPTDNILIDNGIGKADEFKNFWEKLSGKDPHYSAAYTPTNKATIERTFGLFKNEFDEFQKNFVAPHKENGRHPTAALSSPEPDQYFEEYKAKLEKYMMGFFIDRVRMRVMDGKPNKISIKNMYDRFMLTYQPRPVTGRDIRLAMSKKEIKRYVNKIELGRDTYIAGEALHASLNDRDYTVFCNPYDLTQVDLHAIEDIIVRETGEIIPKGGHVATLNNTRMHPEKRAQVMKLRNKGDKMFRKALDVHQTARQIEHPTPDSVSTNGNLLDEKADQRKRMEIAIKETLSTIDSVPDSRLLTPDSRLSTLDSTEYVLTFEEDQQ